MQQGNVEIREKMVRVTFECTQAEADKLQALAAASTTAKQTWTPAMCLRRFIQTCQPGGGGWVHPSKAVR